MGFCVREINFYNQVASQVTMRVPNCYAADMAPGGVPFVLLLEEATGARVIDQLEGASRADCERVIESMSTLHARFWESDELYALDWWADQGNATFNHTDCRADNYLFGGSAGDGVTTVPDFQLCTRHVGVWDIANFLGASITTENRRAWEDDLVRGYHAQLLAKGVGADRPGHVLQRSEGNGAPRQRGQQGVGRGVCRARLGAGPDAAANRSPGAHALPPPGEPCLHREADGIAGAAHRRAVP